MVTQSRPIPDPTRSREPAGSQLRNLRRGKQLGLREAATRAGINHGYLSQLERGRIATPSPLMLRKLAQAYDEPAETLLRWAGYLDDTPAALTPNQARLLHIVGDPTDAEVRAIEMVLGAIREARAAQNANTIGCREPAGSRGGSP